MNAEDLQQIAAVVAAAEQRITEATIANLADLRTELTSRTGRIENRLDRIDNRLDRMSESMQILQAAVAITNRWADNLDKTISQEIADIHRRLEALEKRAS